MKVILKESQFGKLLNEAKGVNEAAIEYTNFIYNLLEPIAIQMITIGSEDVEEIDIYDKDLLKFIKNDPDTFKELPIGELELDLAFIPTKNQLVGDKPFAVGGGFYDLMEEENGGSYMIDSSFIIPKKILEEVSKSIHAKLQFEIYVNPSFNQTMMDDVLFDLRDAITHEVNHLYESYKKWENTGKGTNDLVKSFAGTRNVNTPRVIFEVYTKFLNFLYYSQPWEIKTVQWEIATEMENYSADKLFEEIIKVANNKNPETVDYHIRNLHKFYIKQHMQHDIATKEAINIKDEVYKTKNLLDLFRKYEKRINNAGKKLKRNYARLMTIEKND